MCRARCITHQGRVLSATGLHNHQPHMKANTNCDYIQSNANSNHLSNGLNISGPIRLTNMTAMTSLAPASTNQTPPPIDQHQAEIIRQSVHDEASTTLSQLHCPTASQTTTTATMTTLHQAINQSTNENSTNPTYIISQHNNNNSLQNMMHSVLTQNPLMNLANITPMMNPMQNHTNLSHTNNIHGSSDLHVVGGQESDANHSMNSPESPHCMQHSSMIRHQMPTTDLNRIVHSTELIHGHQQHSAELTVVSNVESAVAATGADSNSVATHHSMQTESFKLEQI